MYRTVVLVISVTAIGLIRGAAAQTKGSFDGFKQGELFRLPRARKSGRLDLCKGVSPSIRNSRRNVSVISVLNSQHGLKGCSLYAAVSVYVPFRL